jgi:hypothetical protein
MPKGRKNGKGAPGKRTGAPRPMNKPAMMDWALRLLRLLNEKKVLTSRVVAEEFDVNIRTGSGTSCTSPTCRAWWSTRGSCVVQATASHAFCGNFAITGVPPFGIDPFDPFRRDLGLHA